MRDFEEMDPQSYAFHSLFSPGSLLLGEDDAKAIRKLVFPDNGIPIKIEDTEEVPVAANVTKENTSKPGVTKENNNKTATPKGKNKKNGKSKKKGKA